MTKSWPELVREKHQQRVDRDAEDQRLADQLCLFLDNAYAKDEKLTRERKGGTKLYLDNEIFSFTVEAGKFVVHQAAKHEVVTFKNIADAQNWMADVMAELKFGLGEPMIAAA